METQAKSRDLIVANRTAATINTRVLSVWVSMTRPSQDGPDL